MVATIPGGNKKGQPLGEADAKDIQWWVTRISDGLEKEPDKKFADKDRAWLTEARAELDRRANGGQQMPATTQVQASPRAARTAINSDVVLYVGAHDDAKSATAALAKLQELGHLISPAPACATLPEGCAILISAVIIDPVNETFPQQGKLGLSKVALEKIAGALSVSWEPSGCRRTDDGRDPYYCSYEAVGKVRNFDGSWRVITNNKVMDLRDGSPTVIAMQLQSEAKARKAKSEGKGDAKEGDWRAQLRDMRFRIAEQAETKAKLRAIRSLGIRASYTREELQKPFFAAQVQFTGRSSDPKIRRMFAQRIADSFLGSAVPMLYGNQKRSLGEPPPFSSVEDDDPIDSYGEEVVDDPYGPDGEAVIDRGDDPDSY